MNSRGAVKPPGSIVIREASKEKMKPHLIKWHKEGKPVNFTMTFTATITGMKPGGVIELSPTAGEESIVLLETHYRKRTIKQLNPLKALEAFIFWCQEGEYPQKSEELWLIHEAIMEAVNVRADSPFGDRGVLITCRSPLCTREIMNKYIEFALQILAGQDIDNNLKDKLFTDLPLSDLFNTWIRQRMVEKDISEITGYEEFAKRFPFCMATFYAGEDLDIAHIQSKGARPDLADNPQNWLRLKHSIHMLQHSSGWDAVLEEFPHLKPVVDKAREL